MRYLRLDEAKRLLLYVMIQISQSVIRIEALGVSFWVIN
jgi:hypothetical protein